MPPDRDLERELRDLGPRVEYPPVPDLARSVRDRLEAEGEGAGPPARARPQLWWIAAAALVLLVAVPVVSLALRDTGGVSSVGGGAGGAAGGVAESGGPTRLAEDADGPTHSAGDDGALAAGAGGGTPSSRTADSGASAASIEDACLPPEPVLEATPSRGAPGDGFGVRGKNFDGTLRDCDDDPTRDVRVEFLQDGRAWELGRLVSDKDSRLTAKLEVPADARPGRATVRATYGQGPPEDPYGRASAEARFLVTE